MNLQNKIKFVDTIFAQEIDGEMVLLDMNTENYFSLDAVGTDIWQLLREGKTLQETRDSLLEMYEVDAATLEKDLMRFIDGLLQNDLASLEA